MGDNANIDAARKAAEEAARRAAQEAMMRASGQKKEQSAGTPPSQEAAKKAMQAAAEKNGKSVAATAAENAARATAQSAAMAARAAAARATEGRDDVKGPSEEAPKFDMELFGDLEAFNKAVADKVTYTAQKAANDASEKVISGSFLEADPGKARVEKENRSYNINIPILL